MFKLLITITILLVANSAQADWAFVKKVDEFTDEKIQHAIYKDASHRIQLSYEGDAVWMFITRKKIGSFEPNGLIEMRVDKNKPLKIDPVKRKMLSEVLGESTFQWEPGTVGFLLWHGKEAEGCGYVGELLQGQQLKVRYQTSSLDRDTFSVSLKGAKDAIVNGLSLTKCGH